MLHWYSLKLELKIAASLQYHCLSSVILMFQWVKERRTCTVWEPPWPLLAFAYPVCFPTGLSVALTLPRNIFSPPLPASIHPHCILGSLHCCATKLGASCLFKEEDPALLALFSAFVCYFRSPTLWPRWGWRTILSATLMWSSTGSQVRV